MGCRDHRGLGSAEERLMLTRRPLQRGLTLIELMVGLAIVAILMVFAAPSFRLMTENSKLRGAAENMASILQTGRTEAITRNGTVELLMTNQPLSTDVDDFAAADAGRNWVLRTKDPTPSASPENILLRSHSANEGGATGGSNTSVQMASTSKTTAATVKSLHFNSLGQVSLNAPEGGTGALKEGATLAFSNPAAGACEHLTTGAGPMRCLNVQVTVSGEIRLCDPKVTEAGDSRKC